MGHYDEQPLTRADVIDACRRAGCVCEPEIHVNVAGEVECAHDVWCPMAGTGRLLATILPNRPTEN